MSKWIRTVKGESQLKLKLDQKPGLTACNRIGIIVTDEFLRMNDERFSFFHEDDEKCENLLCEYYGGDFKFPKSPNAFRENIVNEIVGRGRSLKKLSEMLKFESIVAESDKYQSLLKERVRLEKALSSLIQNNIELKVSSTKNVRKKTKELEDHNKEIEKFEKGNHTLLGMLKDRKMRVLESLVCDKKNDPKGSQFMELMKNSMIQSHSRCSFFCTSKKHTSILISKKNHVIVFDSAKSDGFGSKFGIPFINFFTELKVASFYDFEEHVFPYIFKSWGNQCDVVVVGMEENEEVQKNGEEEFEGEETDTNMMESEEKEDTEENKRKGRNEAV